MALFSFISLRRLSRFWEKAKEYIANKISEAVIPEGQKEVLSVLTYSASAPSEATAGDYYINSLANKLYVYSSGSWSEQAPSEDIIYVAYDTSHLYLWNGSSFVDATGVSVDNIIYVTNLNSDLAGYTEKGMYTVSYTYAGVTEWYTMVVQQIRGRVRIGRPTSTSYFQTLSNSDGWMRRRKVDSGAWEEWETHNYSYTGHMHAIADVTNLQSELDEIRDWAVVGWVL